jgi:hypothetical protein
MGVVGEIQKGGHTGLLYAGAIGLLLSDIIPTPADGLYFYTERKLKEKLENGTITSSQYWNYSALAYYGYNPIWWSIVLGSIVLTKGDYKQKAKVGLAVIGAGAVIGVLHKNIEIDKERYGK